MQHLLDGGDLLVETIVGRGAVDDVENEVCDEGLLEGRGEAFDELCRETPDEADRVGHEIAASVEVESARGRIEGLEETILDGHLCTGERVHHRRFADIGVPRERDGRRFGAATLLAADFALLAELLQAPSQERDPAPREPPIGLELRLAGAAGSEAATKAFEVLPHAPHARKVVFELGELHLELSLGTSSVLGEDVQDQLRTIDHAGLERILQRSLLRRLQLVVDDEDLGSSTLVRLPQLLQLAFAEVCPALGPRAMLDQLADRLHESSPCELTQLGQLRVGIDSLGQHGGDEPALQRGVRLAWDHGWIMPAIRPRSGSRYRLVVHVSPALRDTGTYPFVKLERAKRRLAAEGVPLIDFGKGDPMEPTDAAIRRALVEALEERMGYPLAEGLPELRAAVAAWCARRFGVELDPDSEIVPTYGSKEAIFLLAQVVVDRGSDKRLVLTTEPGYPVPDRGAAFAGADVQQLPLLEENAFLPDLDSVPADTWRRTAIVWINYPNNPTGALAPIAFLCRLAMLSREHDFLIASDEAYTELWFEEAPRSALEAREAGNVAVFNTLSKRSSMTGYRSGFVAGSEQLIGALKQFRPSVGTAPQEFVQRASIVAWNDETHVERTRDAYRRKREALLPVLRRKGIRVAGSVATMYLWLEVPGEATSEEFAAGLLEHGLIVSPGSFFGAAGEGYWRMALVPTEEECRRAGDILDAVL